MQFFHRLGSLVELRWRERDYNESVFPEIAGQALAEVDAVQGPSPWDMICSLHANLELPTQVKDKFSDLVITLHYAPRFHISAYFWLDGTTSIHQHAFSGAFQVLLGSSIHSHYEFEESQAINPHMSVGNVRLKDIQLLRKGDIREIHSGAQFIHSLFHLDRPSVTLTIRTNGAANALPQFDYLKPYLAIDPFFDDSITARRIQSIQLLLRMKHPDVDSFVGQLVGSLDFQTTFSILNVVFKFFTDPEIQRVFDVSNGPQRFRAIMEKAREKHGSLVDLLLPVMQEIHRKDKIVERRKQLKTAEQRFFLAVLLNVSEKARILELVKERFPERDPIDTICDWVMQLSEIKVAGGQSNLLGIDDFNEDYLTVFRGSLQNDYSAELERALQERVAPETRTDLIPNLQAMRRVLENSDLLKVFLD